MGQHEKEEGQSGVCKAVVAGDCRGHSGGAVWSRIIAAGGHQVRKGLGGCGEESVPSL